MTEMRFLRLAGLERVIYPETGFRKKDVVRYYQEIAPFMLPHLRGRPVSLFRYPTGVTGECFPERHCPSIAPSWLETMDLAGSRYCTVSDLPSLIWLVNFGTLEFQVSLSKAPRLEVPTSLVFILSSALETATGLKQPASVARAALLLRLTLEDTGLVSVAKAAGPDTIHVCVPLNPPAESLTSAAGYSGTRLFARATIEHLRHQGTFFREAITLDWTANRVQAAAVCAYSLLPTSHPSVAAPVTWEAVELTAKGRRGLMSSPEEALRRAEKRGDIFSAMLTCQQDLPVTAARWLRAA